MSSRLSLMVASVALAFAASTAFAAPQTAPTSAPAKNSQQQRMADCNKQATGKTGDDRKTFMSSCLKGESAAPAKMTQQHKTAAQIRKGIIAGDWKTVDLQSATSIN